MSEKRNCHVEVPIRVTAGIVSVRQRHAEMVLSLSSQSTAGVAAAVIKVRPRACLCHPSHQRGECILQHHCCHVQIQ